MIASNLSVDGGSLVVGLLAMGLAVTTVIIGAWVAYVAYTGYQRSGDRPALFLAVGIVLTFTAHTSVRIAFPTAGASSALTDTAAVAIQIVGLGFVLYTVYGRPEYADVRFLGWVVFGGIVVFLTPIIAIERAIVHPESAVLGVNTVAALVGGFVAAQAYRGYRRYGSRPMMLLAAGILLSTAGSFLGAHVVDTLVTVSDATVLVFVGGSELAGLILVLRSLTGKW